MNLDTSWGGRHPLFTDSGQLGLLYKCFGVQSRDLREQPATGKVIISDLNIKLEILVDQYSHYFLSVHREECFRVN